MKRKNKKIGAPFVKPPKERFMESFKENANKALGERLHPAGKGSRNRSFTSEFRGGYDEINWK